MSRSGMMARLLRLARLAERCEQTGESPHEAIGHDAVDSSGWPAAGSVDTILS